MPLDGLCDSRGAYRREMKSPVSLRQRPADMVIPSCPKKLETVNFSRKNKKLSGFQNNNDLIGENAQHRAKQQTKNERLKNEKNNFCKLW